MSDNYLKILVFGRFPKFNLNLRQVIDVQTDGMYMCVMYVYNAEHSYINLPSIHRNSLGRDSK